MLCRSRVLQNKHCDGDGALNHAEPSNSRAKIDSAPAPATEPMQTTTPVKESTFRRVFKAFHYRDFRLMWIGACTSSIGTWMQIVAQGWLIYRLSHSAFLLALDQFLAGIPIFLFSLIGGVVADRSERKRILLISQWVQMASA